jgi:hypothetical protein
MGACEPQGAVGVKGIAMALFALRLWDALFRFFGLASASIPVSEFLSFQAILVLLQLWNNDLPTFLDLIEDQVKSNQRK